MTAAPDQAQFASYFLGGTRVLCCYATLHPETERSVKAFAPGAEFVDTTADIDTYGKVLEAAWTGENDLVVIEQDIMITPDVIHSFESCPEPWCVYSYQGPPGMGYLYHSLGCTKFSAKLQRDYPLRGFISGGPWWWLLDARIERRLDGVVPHVHGHVEHFHRWPDEKAEFAKEKQPDEDKSMKLYRNKPDGTRGEYVRDLSHGETMMNFRIVEGVLCAVNNSVIIPYIPEEDKKKWPVIRYGGQEAASNSSSVRRSSHRNKNVGGPLPFWRQLRRYFSKQLQLRSDPRTLLESGLRPDRD